MARPEVDNSKYIVVQRLREGDLIQLTTGEKVIFERCKQKDFIGTMEDGKKYSIFINKFDKFLEKGNIIKPLTSVPNDKEFQVRNLILGDKVKLTNGDIAEFVKVNQKRFVGIINGSEYTIPFGMFDSIFEKANTNTAKRIQSSFEYLFWVHGNGDDIEAIIKSSKELSKDEIEKTKIKLIKKYHADYVEDPININGLRERLKANRR